MRGRGPAVAATLAGVTLFGGSLASGATGATVPNLPWTELLPPLPAPSQTERVRVKRCRKASLKCVRVQIKRMKRLRDRLGCDHRAVFATTYLTLTRQLLKTVKADPRSRQGQSGAERNAGYEPVVEAVRAHYDPILRLTNSSWHPIDDVAGLEVVRAWRELVWRNAERLVHANSPAERTQIAEQIELNAALQAQLIALVPTPGYRATRDAYCQQQQAD